MKTSEFRRGNLICTNNEIKVIDVIEAERLVFIKETNRHGVSIHPFSEIKEVKPIPLTEELLKRCGFKKTSDYVFEHESGVFFDAPNNWNNTEDYPVGIDAPMVSLYGSDVVIRAIYLHDLQNKFYAIKGKELDIDMTEPITGGIIDINAPLPPKQLPLSSILASREKFEPKAWVEEFNSYTKEELEDIFRQLTEHFKQEMEFRSKVCDVFTQIWKDADETIKDIENKIEQP